MIKKYYSKYTGSQIDEAVKTIIENNIVLEDLSPELVQKLYEALQTVKNDILGDVVPEYSTLEQIGNAIDSQQLTIDMNYEELSKSIYNTRLNITNLQNTKADKTEIPTKVSQLEYDVELDLSDYYTKQEVNNQLSSIPKFSIEVVAELPTENISNTTVYLVQSTGGTEDDFAEYIYINGEWELLGHAKADLKNYYSKAETEANFVSKKGAAENQIYSKNTYYVAPKSVINPTEEEHLVNKKYVDEKFNQLESRVAYLEKTKPITAGAIMTPDTVASAGLLGEGAAENPYLIQSAADMKYLQQEVNNGVDYAGEYFELTTDIDMNNINFVIGTGESDRVLNTFAGHFDGKNHSIINMNISNDPSNILTGRALFISLKAGGSIENLSVFGIVDGAQCSAGLVGWNYGAIKNCKNYADVTHNAKNCGGGIAGTCNANGTIIDCYNYGTIYNNGTNQKTGGIVGVIESTAKGIINCTNYGKVIGYKYVGGISGSATTDSIIQSCNNYGAVENTNTHIGGIVGYATSTSIQNCNNNGIVKGGTQRIGGIAGQCEDVITDCTNGGNVVSEQGEWVGGIVGVPLMDIKNCINNGNITGNIYVGGIAGSGKGSAVYSIRSCENTGTVKATSSFAGGILGGTPTSTSVTLSFCTSSGNVISADKFAGAFVGNVIKECVISTDSCVNNTSIEYIKGNDAPEK